MGKNANKKAKFKPIVFEIQKDRFKHAVKNQLEHITSYLWERSSVLSGVLFKFENNTLIMVSTDGNTLLKQEIPVNELIKGGNYEIVLSALHLAKAGIKNHYEGSRKHDYRRLDNLQITINADHAVIEDKFNGVKYVIPEKIGTYPEFEQLLTEAKEEKRIKIAFNTRLMAKFEQISDTRSGIATLSVNNEDPLKVIMISSNNNEYDIKATGLLMPCKLRE
jgi:DNA polymerase III sliding clamp (beta) subunit (PCNA family)